MIRGTFSTKDSISIMMDDFFDENDVIDNSEILGFRAAISLFLFYFLGMPRFWTGKKNANFYSKKKKKTFSLFGIINDRRFPE